MSSIYNVIGNATTSIIFAVRTTVVLMLIFFMGTLYASTYYQKINNESISKQSSNQEQLTIKLAESRALISQQIDQTDFSKDSRLLITRLIQRAEIDRQVGANIAALQDLQFAFRLATSTNQPDLIANVASEIASIHQARGEHTIALSYAEQAYNRYKQQELTQPANSVLLMSVSSLLATGQHTLAETRLKSIASFINATADVPQQGRYFRLLGETKLAREDLQGSLAAFEQAQTLTLANDYRELAYIQLLVSKAHSQQQNMDEAISALVTAFEFANLGKVPFLLHQSLQLQRANLLSQLNEHEAAYQVTQSVIKDRELVQPIAEIKQILDMHANFQLNLQQQENADLKQENEHKTIQIESKQMLSTLYLIVMGLLFCLSCLMMLVFIRGRKYRRHLERIAHTDQLTNLHSRSRALELLSYHQELFGRTKQTYCVAIVDLDYFKRINDTYGHQTGDAVLRQFGQLSQEKFRKADIIGRIGGEEFLFILPNTPYKQAIEVFASFGKSLLDIGRSLGIEQATTASVGLVTPYEKEQVLQIIKRADDALYQAKANGRNTVVFGNNLSTLQNTEARVN